jgi:sugar O-acyltransferase (sialic acid O-acetyltransferase NeuD family)
MQPKRMVIIGAGGYAREVAAQVADIRRHGEPYEVVGFVVTDLARLGPRDSRERVLGDYEWLAAHRDRFDVFALGIGTPAARLAVATELAARFPDVPWPALVHPSVLADRASLVMGRGALLAPGVVATVNVTLEDFAMVNITCTLGHETRVGRGAVINPGANLSGGVTVGAGVLMGTGAVVLQYLTIGEGATVGAGAVVTKDVPPGLTVVGAPARPLVREAKTPIAPGVRPAPEG